MEYTYYELAILFFLYAFLGWVIETGYATIKNKKFRNRGFATGPFCYIYGVSAVLLTIMLRELRNNWFFLFLGSAIITTTIEWFTGKILERMNRKRWWDYSDKKWNYDGYICLQSSLIWGVLGTVTVRYFNDFFWIVYDLLPDIISRILVWILLGIGGIDILLSILAVYHKEERAKKLFTWNKSLQTHLFGIVAKLANHIMQRMGNAYPALEQTDEVKEKEKEADKCTLVQLFWLFVIGAFLGDIVETLYCRLTAGVWMSRSSLVWGAFSVVWGIAIALATALLHRDINKPDRYIFMIGTFMGGAYEYACSVFTEIVFGKVFWDYSEIPFNLGGRINLLYCFFWGIAAVVWLKKCYPPMIRMVNWILAHTKHVVTLLLAVFMAVNMGVSCLALARYDMRGKGIPAEHKWEEVMDEHFGDARMKQIYPNAKAQ